RPLRRLHPGGGQRALGPQQGRDRQLLPRVHGGAHRPAERRGVQRHPRRLREEHLRGLHHLSRGGRCRRRRGTPRRRRYSPREAARRRRRDSTTGRTALSDTAERTSAPAPQRLDRVIIRFAGDSGDGMQLTGDRFTSASAVFGNDLATLPDFPAEIRAPAGTLAGVSAFQVHISDHAITTPGDAPNVLVAMNPAALRNELPRLEPGSTVIVNVDAFEARNLAKAGYDANPLEDGSLEAYKVYEIPMTSLTQRAGEQLGGKPRDAERSKSFFALGLVSCMYTRPVETTIRWIEERFAAKPQVRDANLAAFRAGHAFGETAELFDHP